MNKKTAASISAWVIAGLSSPGFARAQTGIVQEAYLKATPNQLQALLGTAADVSGDTVVAGAPGRQLPPEFADEAHVFQKLGTAWVHQTRLVASNTNPFDLFGEAVAIDGETVVVGAPYEDSPATGVNGFEGDGRTDSGAAYVFVRGGTTWMQQAYLKASNTGPGDEFGVSVAIDGDTIVVGASEEDSAAAGVGAAQGDGGTGVGAAYVFVRNGTDWTQQAYLKASNPDDDDWFGDQVAISGDTIVVAAPREGSGSVGIDGDQGNTSFEAGAVYVFVRGGTTWSQQAYLKASNTDANDWFGASVAIDGNTIAVGAHREASTSPGVDADPSDNSGYLIGAVYVFVRAGGSWSQQVYLKASNPGSDAFGGFLALSGDRLIAAAAGEDGSATGVNGVVDEAGSGSGAAYLFVRSGGQTWTQQAYMKASNTDIDDRFGSSVGIDGSTILIGAFTEDSAAEGVNGDQSNDASMNAGALYVFDASEAPFFYCTAKLGSSGCLAAIGTSNGALQPLSGLGNYAITAANVVPQKNGLLFAGNTAAANLPFNGGVLCIQPPLKRGPVAASGGLPASLCSGSFSTVVNDGNVLPFGLDGGPGGSVWYQYWYRDPQNGVGQLGTTLSNAVQLEFQ